MFICARSDSVTCKHRIRQIKFPVVLGKVLQLPVGQLQLAARRTLVQNLLQGTRQIHSVVVMNNWYSHRVGLNWFFISLCIHSIYSLIGLNCFFSLAIRQHLTKATTKSTEAGPCSTVNLLKLLNNTLIPPLFLHWFSRIRFEMLTAWSLDTECRRDCRWKIEREF